MSKKVWVLTYEINDYDQHGEYFEAVWENKPSVQALADYFQKSETHVRHTSVMEAVAFLEHVRSGGGRRGTEHVWYNLEEVELK